MLTHAGRNYGIMKYDIDNDLSRLNEWARLWLVDFNTKKNPKPWLSQLVMYHI